LARLARERPVGSKIYVTTDSAPAPRWYEVLGVERDRLKLDNGQAMAVSQTTAFVATYPSGEILLTSTPTPKTLPKGAFFVRRATGRRTDTLTDADVSATSSCIAVAFGPRRSTPTRGDVYATKVTNRCAHPVRVTQFGAYSRIGGVWKLNTIADGFFTGQQFREWYGVPGDGWLAPGASATDPENYGPGALWVYFFETRDGQSGRALAKAP
jgi:hypothetical protein